MEHLTTVGMGRRSRGWQRGPLSVCFRGRGAGSLLLLFLVLSGRLAILAERSLAQAPTTNPSSSGLGNQPRSTIVQVELLTAPDLVGLQAQDWRGVFEQLEVPLQIRRANLGDKPELKERTVGTLRYVTALGQLDRSGKLVFPGRAFTRAETPALKEWLNELKTFGAQGNPLGQPLWGLNQAQFEALFAALAVVQTEELQTLSLKEAVDKFGFPAQYPVRWSPRVDERSKERVIRQGVAGFAKATALALALNEATLGFRPARTPTGSIELVIEPQPAEKSEQWPIGWPLQRQVPEALPTFFAMTNIELDRVPVEAMLEAATEVTQVPIRIDTAELQRRKIDLAAIHVSYPLKKSTWSLATRSMLVPQKLNREYWQDEAGRAFVWITPIGKERPTAVKGLTGVPER